MKLIEEKRKPGPAKNADGKNVKLPLPVAVNVQRLKNTLALRNTNRGK